MKLDIVVVVVVVLPVVALPVLCWVRVGLDTK